ncbi:MAG: hypothetical protein HFE81_06320 [Bacilli bacterium]|nr:hypothetical protein [Bacilli bacterium]
MLVLSGKEILKGIDLKLDETIQKLVENFSDEIMSKDKQLGIYEEQIIIQKEKIELLEEKNRNLFAQTGGLTKGNNKLQKEKLKLEAENKSLKEKVTKQTSTIEKLSKDTEAKIKLQAIIEQQEKIISRRIAPLTKEMITNYDKKNPMMK